MQIMTIHLEVLDPDNCDNLPILDKWFDLDILDQFDQIITSHLVPGRYASFATFTTDDLNETYVGTLVVTDSTATFSPN
jgi:hypothetical protein